MFVPTAEFIPHCISGNVNEFLQLLNNQNSSHTSIELASNLIDTSLSLVKRQVSPYVMRGLVRAIKQNKRVDIDYVSLTNPNGEGRIIQPYMFVKTGLRWHLRAFDEKHQQFRDFVLSRFKGQPELMGDATHTAEQDNAWQTILNLSFVPDPRLNKEQKQVLEQDYQMKGGRLEVPVRAALAQYLIQEMHVNIKEPFDNPQEQQLILINKSEINKWLFSN
ncbi:MAG: WYL domain-containing protein [Paraglaciecola sp.]|uniref:WYL domain-containing protein n=1 Tax=Paraglaciecola sp. TaxID=1920173 RepID=UPI003297837B